MNEKRQSHLSRTDIPVPERLQLSLSQVDDITAECVKSIENGAPVAAAIDAALPKIYRQYSEALQAAHIALNRSSRDAFCIRKNFFSNTPSDEHFFDLLTYLHAWRINFSPTRLSLLVRRDEESINKLIHKWIERHPDKFLMFDTKIGKYGTPDSLKRERTFILTAQSGTEEGVRQ